MVKTLMTSFDIWEAHHCSNSSDDLLSEMETRGKLDNTTHLLRKIAVDFRLAPQAVIAQMQELEPDVVVCCGMAETRSHLTIESCGTYQNHVLQTSLNLDRIVRSLQFTTISHDAGEFVCNHLYYSILKYIKDHQLPTQAVFVHVPLLSDATLELVVNDFSILLWQMNHY
jgi:pyroglutamyl-peptidase